MRNLFTLVACILLSSGIFAQTNELKDTQVIIDTLHYDGPNYDGVGLGSAATFEVHAFFPASMLAAHNTAGNTIKSIDLFIKGASNVVSATIKIRPNQSSVSYSQSFTAGEGWNNVVLTTPFAIPATDLYVGYELVVSGGFPLGCDAGPVNTNANWILYNGSWLHLTDLNAAMTYNWNIRARVDGSAGPSNDATLSDLKVDGTTVAGFSPNTITYSKTYPYGTTAIPVVTATTTHVSATKVITNATSMPGTATVLVTAQDGTTQKTYTVNFLVAAPSSDATLSDLKVDGTTVSGFNPSTYTYTLAYPYGTTSIPVVTATTTHASATKVITNATSMPGSATVQVTAQDGTTQLTYAINFTVDPPSSVATLSDLKVDGTTVSGFNASTYTYTLTYPYGTTAIPVVTATTTHASATKVITNATSMPGSATVLVTAQDGTTQLTYTVNYLVDAPSTDASLSALNVDGSLIAGFSPTVYSYSITLPYGSTVVPVVTATANNVNATYNVNAATGLPGITTVVVTAQDGITSLNYTVEFSIASAGSDASLNSLLYGGVAVPGFSPIVLTYNIELPQGTVIVPPLSATTNDVNASLVITDAATLPGTSTVVVTAQDAVTINTYSVNFTVLTGLEINDMLQVSVYPVPTNGIVNIESEQCITFIISDVYGRTITSGISHGQIDISEYPAGIYFLALSSGTANNMVRIVKN
jgi:hypothetical protein